MPTLGGIIRSARKDGTKSVRHVRVVDMLEGHDPGTAVESASRKYAVQEGFLERGIPVEQRFEGDLIVVAQFWRI